MSFRFNAEVFKDNTFNEQIKEKLTKALNSSSSSSSVMRTDVGGDVAQMESASSSNSLPLTAATVTESSSKQTSATTTTTTTLSTTKKSQSRSSMSSRKLDILKSEIIVSKVNFPTTPSLEILDLDVSAQPRSLVKGICKISCKDAMLQIQTEIESNLLLVYSDYSPDFTTPTMICKDSFTIPITMIFSEIHLEAITNIFVKNSGIGISFNDVNLDFKFDCSIKILQSTIEKRLKKSMQLLFKEVLPSVIFNMSQSLFTADDSTKSISDVNDSGSQEALDGKSPIIAPKIVLDECDLQELSPANMLRLSTLISSRQTLSLNATVLNVPSTIPGCLERQNLHRFNSRIPSLSNFYAAFRETKEQPSEMKRSTSSLMFFHNSSGGDQNVLPAKVLEKNAYDLSTITNIQTRIFERGTDENVRPRRRKIKLGKKKQKATKKSKNESTNDNQPACLTPVDGDTDIFSTQTMNSDETLITSPLPKCAVKPISLKTDSSKINTEEGSDYSHSTHPGATLKLPVSFTSKYLPDKGVLNFEPQEVSRTTSPRRLNLLEETNYFSYRPELHRLRSSVYSPLGKGNTIFTSGKELTEQKQLLENRKLSFVGLNHRGITWGNDDDPPPYMN